MQMRMTNWSFFRNLPSSSLIVGIVGACEAGVGRVDAVAGVFCGVGAVERSSTRLFLMNCSLDIMRWTECSDKERVDAESGGCSASQGSKVGDGSDGVGRRFSFSRKSFVNEKMGPTISRSRRVT